MKTKHIILILIGLFIGTQADAQILKKLKKRAEQAAERTLLKKTDEIVSKKTEKTIDDVTSPGDKNSNDSTDSIASQKETASKNAKYANPSLLKNTEAKRAHYTSDVKVVSWDEEKQTEMTIYFDADAVAMQSQWTDPETGKAQTSYADSEGFFIAYNDDEKRYTKTALMSMPGMNMMAPSMMSSAYKLPTEAIYGAMEDMQNKGLVVYPFMHVDFPFVLKPEFYRGEMVSNLYNEKNQACRGSMGCTKFSVTEAGYEGSYQLFDSQERLIEINIVVKDDPNFGSGKGKIEYFYEDCTVNVPSAVEKKMPGQDLFKMGLDPNKN